MPNKLPLQLKWKTYYATRDGRVAYITHDDPKKMTDSGYRGLGAYIGRVEGMPGEQLWDWMGHTHRSSIEEYYSVQRDSPPDHGLDLVDFATKEEDIERYRAFAETPLDKKAIEAFLSYESFNVWVGQRENDTLPEGHAYVGVRIVLEYLKKGCPVLNARVWKMASGYERHGEIVGLEFLGLRYVGLPEFLRVLQREECWRRGYQPTYGEVWKKARAKMQAIETKNLSFTWVEGENAEWYL